MKRVNSFWEWQASLQWDAERAAFVAPDGSLWELENGETETYAEVSPPSESSALAEEAATRKR